MCIVWHCSCSFLFVCFVGSDFMVIIHQWRFVLLVCAHLFLVSPSLCGCVAFCRQFLWSFRLPGEAQKIDRMMECFAARYCELNPEVFTNTGEAPQPLGPLLQTAFWCLVYVGMSRGKVSKLAQGAEVLVEDRQHCLEISLHLRFRISLLSHQRN